MKDQTTTLLDLLAASGRGLHAMLTRLTLREDVAEDLMQELFIKLVGSKGFANAANKAAYARRAAVNLAFDWRRAQQRRGATSGGLDEEAGSGVPALAKLIRDEQLGQILEAIGQLQQPARYACVMRHIEQESYKAIGDQIGRTAHQTRALCHKALAQLRAILNGTDADQEGGPS